MALEEFMNKPGREFALMSQIADYLSKNFRQYLGEYYYIHLRDMGAGQSMIDEVQNLKRVSNPWHFVNIDREHTAYILIRSYDEHIMLLMCGENEWAEFTITEKEAKLVDGPRLSSLPDFRKCPMTPYELMDAFGFIGESLQETKRKCS